MTELCHFSREECNEKKNKKKNGKKKKLMDLISMQKPTTTIERAKTVKPLADYSKSIEGISTLRTVTFQLEL